MKYRNTGDAQRAICLYIAGCCATSTNTMATAVGSTVVMTLTWITPLVVLKATTCVIQGVVYSRLLTVYTEECIASLVYSEGDTVQDCRYCSIHAQYEK